MILIVITQNNAALSSTFRLAHETQVAGGEIRQIRKDCRQVRSAYPKPGRESGRVLIEGCRRNPATVFVGVIGAAQCQRRKLSVNRVPLYRSSENQLVTAPRVVGASIGARF